ncbi:hypothetical protein [Tahibacter soli]|uniref:Uncharacterized protein n=1 Tax=Tahibacter soli TaxID=2983605 RepID=A0A9X4BHH9_9GAMM|nr:hypothetical protein [Tahibacter soli]MDC8011097.1 hypothetical protein [Tahibacter soli]
MAARTAPHRPSRSARFVAWFIAFPLLFLLWCRFGAPPLTTDDLDPSWTSVLGYAFRHGMRWGHDIVFTYGPLGFLHPGASRWGPLADVYWWSQIALALTQAALAAALFEAADTSRRIALVAAALICAVGVAGDVLWFVVPAYALAAILYRSNDTSSRAGLTLLIVVSATYVSALACIKFSLAPLAVLWWFGASAVLALNRRFGAAALCFVLVPATFLALWLLAGQHVGDIGRQLAYGIEISAGYARVMSVFPRLTIEIAGALTLFACGAVMLLALWQHRRALAVVVVILYFGAALLLAWRSGFTRADLHTAVFFACVAFLIPQLPRITESVLRPFGLPALAVALFSAGVFLRLWQVDGQQPLPQLVTIGATQIRNNFSLLTNREAHNAPFPALAARAAETFALPRIRAEIGDRTVDLVGYQQAVLEINRFNYAPRPVFQNYTAYTRPLSRLNENFLLGERAPDYVMLSFSPIDDHLATIDDPLSILSLLRRYSPVLLESKYLLLKKDRPAMAPFEVRTPATPAALGDWIDIPADAPGVVLSFSAQLSLPGKLVSALLREPIWFIEVALEDGTIRRLRMTRDAGETGFLVAPLVTSLDDFSRLFMREPMPRVARVRLLPQREALAFLQRREFTYALTPLAERDLPAPPDAAHAIGQMYPGFKQRPIRAEGIVNRIEEDQRPALFAHAPSTLTFAVAAGTYVVEGEAGIRAEALTAPPCAHGDGVAIVVQADGGPAQEVLRLNPFAKTGAPNPARFRSARLTLAADATVQLRVGPGEAGDQACDWAYLRDVAIVPDAP